MKFSIIVPMYNVEKYLDKCIESLLAQSYINFEIILVNDKSTDRTLDIAKNWIRKDNRICLVENKVNSGLSKSRNVGMQKAKGDYILFVDSDDYIEKDSLKIFENIISKFNPDIIYGGYYLHKFNGEIEKHTGYKSDGNKLYSASHFLYSELKKRNLYAAATFGIYNRTFLMEHNLFFKVGILHEDEEWTPRVLMSAKNVYLSKFNFYHYIKREGSITMQKDRTKNGLDLMNTCYELDEYSNRHIKDNKLLRLYKNQLAKLYLKSICIGKLYRKDYKENINRFYPICHAVIPFDILKSVLFMFNIHLYVKLDSIYGDSLQ